MTTNVTLIGRSLRLLGVLSETETPSAEMGAECLAHLNMLMEQLEVDGIVLGWFTQSLTTDTAPIPGWTEAGVVSKLAQRLQVIYPASSLPQWVMNDEMNGFGTIARRCMLDNMTPADLSDMPMGSGWRGTFDITSG